MREGFAVEDFMKPDRVVVGTSNPKAEHVMRDIYEPFLRSGNPIYVMDEKVQKSQNMQQIVFWR